MAYNVTLCLEIAETTQTLKNADFIGALNPQKKGRKIAINFLN